MKRNTSVKFLSVILSAVMTVALLPFAATQSFAETSQDGLWHYEIIDSTSVSLVSENGETAYLGANTEITIPSEIDGYTVTKIGENAFAGDTNITAVHIPDTVTFIGMEAFARCSALESIVIPDSVETLDGSVFDSCSSLESITLPDAPVLIDAFSFMGTAYFDNPDNWYDGALYIGNFLVYVDPELQNLSIKDGTRYVLYGAAAGSESLVSVTMTDSVEYIEYGAFYGCPVLESVRLSDNLHEISEMLFEDCSSLNNINLPLALDTICEGAFRNCTALEEIEIPDTVSEIGSRAFLGCTSLTDINIPAGVSQISDRTFFMCSALTEISIPENVSIISEYAFFHCDSLQTVKIYNPNVSFGDECFENCNINTIYGFIGSTAEDFANENSYSFIPLDDLTWGDADGDGEVGIGDYTLVKLYICGDLELDDTALLLADVNFDKAVDMFDLFLINKMIYC